jgi:hypothetical protein
MRAKHAKRANLEKGCTSCMDGMPLNSETFKIMLDGFG